MRGPLQRQRGERWREEAGGVGGEGGGGRGGGRGGEKKEELVAGVWSEVLGRGELGREENFFDLGGHSLTATQVVSRVRREFGVRLALRELFEAPTVREFALRIEQG